MKSLKERCKGAFPKSRKLNLVQPSEAQLNNVVSRLKQIFTDEELAVMDDKMLLRQVERVWPIAQHIDQV